MKQNILILKKKSKLNYLLEKYGKDLVQKSSEYETFQNAMNTQTHKCSFFIEKMLKYANTNQTVKVLTDSFLSNDLVSNQWL